ncbi:hypothetical protein B0H13DRAFT_2370924 [Mycena leptocephala]|nr:hypothetical protein B0H13DRAFT_2370924 [Mycena leptocephala]
MMRRRPEPSVNVPGVDDEYPCVRRELFSPGVVDEADEEHAGAGQWRDVGSMGQKQRAYWGRRQHPELGVKGAGAGALGGVEKGSVQALIHELVFATVFLQLQEQCGSEEARRREEGWRNYALAVLLCVPILIGRARVETELIRCAKCLVSGAVPEEAECTVAWMVGEYLRLHGAPADADAWEDFRAEAIPAFFPASQPVSSSMKTSTHAMYAPTRFASLTNTLSPRPQRGNARMLGLLDALGQSRGGLSLRMPWAALEVEGLSRDVLLALDPHVIARSLTLFHRAVLEQAPDNPTAAAFVDPGASDAFVPLLDPRRAHEHGSVQGGMAQGRKQPATSRPHSMGEVISVWARAGELCRAAGDECSWRAIVGALCSAPVARLDKVWRRVEPPALAAVEGWVRMEGDGWEVREPRVTPWGGDLRQRLKDEVDASHTNEGGGAKETLLKFLLCPRRVSLMEDEVGEDVKLMFNYWRERFAEGGGNGGIAANVDQFMVFSLATEPPRKGLFEPHYWAQAANQTPYASLIPLLFPEVFLTSAVIDRAQLLRGRVDGSTLLRLEQHHHLNSTVIPVYNGEVLLSVWNGLADESFASSRSSRIFFVAGDGIAAEPLLSHVPSIRVKPRSSLGLDPKASIARAARRNSLPSLCQRRTLVASEPSSEPMLHVRLLVRLLAGMLNRVVDITAFRPYIGTACAYQRRQQTSVGKEGPTGGRNTVFLVHRSRNVFVSVADDNGEMSLRESKARELVVDQMEFSAISKS